MRVETIDSHQSQVDRLERIINKFVLKVESPEKGVYSAEIQTVLIEISGLLKKILNCPNKNDLRLSELNNISGILINYGDDVINRPESVDSQYFAEIQKMITNTSYRINRMLEDTEFCGSHEPFKGKQL